MPDAPYLLLPLRRRDGTIRAHAKIDTADSRLAVHRWSLNDKGYAQRHSADGTTLILLHREVLGLTPGDGLEGDHINGNRLDYRRANLRIATRALNGQNRAPHQNVSSPHRGVSWDRRRLKWYAYAHVDRRMVYLGRYDDEQEAAAVARAYRLTHMPFTNESRT